MSTKDTKRKELADFEEGEKRYYVVILRPEDEDRIVKKTVEALRTEMETLSGTLVEGIITTMTSQARQVFEEQLHEMKEIFDDKQAQTVVEIVIKHLMAPENLRRWRGPGTIAIG